jgi:predicted secreted protein
MMLLLDKRQSIPSKIIKKNYYKGKSRRKVLTKIYKKLSTRLQKWAKKGTKIILIK